MHAPERPQTLKAIASAQFSRVASSNVVNRAADIASRLRAQAVQSYSQAGDNEPRSQQQQGWGAWAWEKLPKRGNNTPNVGIEKVTLFPGWATRRYLGREGECMLKTFSGHYVSQRMPAEFSVDVHVSGFASSLRPPELATRSQRALMKMARTFAALPPLPVDGAQEVVSGSGSGMLVPQQAWSKSEQDLVRNLPLPPSEMSEEAELKAIQAEFEQLPSDLPEPVANASNISLSELKKMHDNLDLRLQVCSSSKSSSTTDSIPSSPCCPQVCQTELSASRFTPPRIQAQTGPLKLHLLHLYLLSCSPS